MSESRSLDLVRLRAAYADGSLTVAALVDEVERRIEGAGDDRVWISRASGDDLAARADALDRLDEAQRADLPLFGVPFAVKDNIDVAGMATTAACPEFAYRAEATAPAVQHLLDAGAVLIGKTNLDQFATGLVGTRSPYGVPRNPFDPNVIPGGSSSGSAVAVAAGLVSFALGTDTAGSGRVPAGLNNVIGVKPTRGRLSTRGVVPACRTLDCVSVFALTAADAAAVLEVADGYDPDDPFARPAATGPTIDVSVARLGLPLRLDFDGDGDAAARFDAELKRAERLGAQLIEIDLAPFHEVAALLYEGPWVAERLAAIESFLLSSPDAVWPVTRQIIESARDRTAVDTFRAIYRLAELHRLTEPTWDRVDALIVPTAPRAYTLEEVEAEPMQHNTRLGTYTNFVNLLDLAAVAVPSGFTANGVPCGITLVAPAHSDEAILALADRLHRAAGVTLGATDAPPPGDLALPAPAPARVRLAVVGAHLRGQPLAHQLDDLGARLIEATRTAPHYRLFALADTEPAKPGLVRVAQGGHAIEVEVYQLDPASFGRFVAAIPPPLGIGTVTLASGATVKGFLCEPIALPTATDISHHGGWRNYLAAAAPA